MIPVHIKVKKGELPDIPGVYLYYDASGLLLYVGKATSLQRRVSSYFVKAHDARIAEMVSHIARIEYEETPTVIEALVLEANRIKALKPKYNILQRDDKTFLYLVITNEAYPKPLLMRGQDLERLNVNPFETKLSGEAKKKFLAVYGPYTSGSSLRQALDLIRKAIPWSICNPPSAVAGSSLRARPGETGKIKPCFDSSIGKCPGVCVGRISKEDYRVIIRQLMLFFDGKKTKLLKEMKKEMVEAAKNQEFEKAARLRNSLAALEHIQDIALIRREEPLPYITRPGEFIDLNGRIEAYDISNISGTSAVGSMVVFENDKPLKSAYRKFKIKTVQGANDFAMMEEVIRRRLIRAQKFPNTWTLPQIMVIDGGEGQVSRVEAVMDELSVKVPWIGIAKGFDRKQDRLVYDTHNKEVSRVAIAGKDLFQRARDEAHRFAVSYHRVLRSKRSFSN